VCIIYTLRFRLSRSRGCRVQGVGFYGLEFRVTSFSFRAERYSGFQADAARAKTLNLKPETSTLNLKP
jgi:hypothetical protein